MSLARQPVPVVALNYQSFGSSQHYHAETRDAFSKPWLKVTWVCRKEVHRRSIACCGTNLPTIFCISLSLWSCGTRCLQQTLARCNLSQQKADPPASVYIGSMVIVLLPRHLILLKIWNASPICMLSVCSGHANLLYMVAS